MHPKRCRIACMSTDLYMHSVYCSMMLLEGTNYDSYFPCTAEGTNYDYYCPPGSIVLKNDAIFHYIMIEAGCSVNPGVRIKGGWISEGPLTVYGYF